MVKMPSQRTGEPRRASPKGRDGRYRLAVVASHLIQYQAPLFRELAKRPEIDLTVFYCSDHGVTAQIDSGFGRSTSGTFHCWRAIAMSFCRIVLRDPTFTDFGENSIQA